jgi:hypothetical protein
MRTKRNNLVNLRLNKTAQGVTKTMVDQDKQKFKTNI